VVTLRYEIKTGRDGCVELSRYSRSLMQRVKMAAAYEGKSVKDFLIELAEARLVELERKGVLPRGK